MNQHTEQNAKSYDEQAQAWDSTIENNLSYKCLEKPAMKDVLPDNLEFKSVLVIGVGAGDELMEIIKQNPRRIVAIDISEKFLEIVREKFSSVETMRMDMMELDFPENSFDFVYSGLAFHYSPDWDKLLVGVNRVLRTGGKLLFSTHHPQTWGTKEVTGNIETNARGIKLTEHKTFLHSGVAVRFFNHENEQAIIDSVTRSGFEVIKSFVPTPSRPPVLPKQDKEGYDNLVKRSKETPLFFIVLAQKL